MSDGIFSDIAVHILFFFSESARILVLSEHNIYEIGTTIDLPCSVDGVPAPTVWWTKTSDSKFNRSGRTLKEENVQVN